jgi:hypothetical protein
MPRIFTKAILLANHREKLAELPVALIVNEYFLSKIENIQKI